MSTPLERRAEVLKLARLLRRDPDSLAYLEQIPAEALRELRDQVTDALFSAQGPALARLAAASKLLPIRVVAVIGERAFGAVLAARIAGLLEPDRAVEMAATMPIPFLADVAAELDPRRASEVIARIPPPRIAAITEELVRREDYVTMGRFVGHLSDGAITAAVQAMDDRALLQVSFVLESKDALDKVVGQLQPERLDSIIAVAKRDRLWGEILDVLIHLQPAQRVELVRRAGSIDEDGLVAIVREAFDLGLAGELIPIVAAVGEADQRRLADVVARLDPSEREMVIEQLRESGMSEQLAMLGEMAG